MAGPGQAAVHRSPDWERIESFIGFGRQDAQVVFIGMEEGLKDAAALDEDLAIRSTYASPIMDLKEAHRGIAGTENYFEPEQTPRQPTWRVIADLMLRRDGNPHPTGDDRRRYRALRLGRHDGDALLAELLPYPHPKSSDWLYARFGRYATRADYENAMLPARKTLLRAVIAEHQREIVVCYGKAHWPHYQDLVDDIRWRDVGPHRVGEGTGLRVVLTTHFSGRAFNADARLAQFAHLALRGHTMEEHEYREPTTYRIRVGTGTEFQSEMQRIIAFLIPRAHVEERYLRRNVPRARLLAIAESDGDIVAVCALKGENADHNGSVSIESGVDIPSDLLELGYAATHEKHVNRGLGKHLNEQIVGRVSGAMYATVHVDNVPEERNLRRCHFRPVGERWERRDHAGKPYQIRLWMRNADAPVKCNGSPNASGAGANSK